MQLQIPLELFRGLKLLEWRQMHKVALVGYGYWGPNLLRNLYEVPDCEVLYVCDKDVAKLKEVHKRYPSIIL